MSRSTARRPAARRGQRLGREQRVGDILQAARDVFSEKGYGNTAVSEIATRIGVVEGTVYKYFDSKRELLHKVLEHWYEEMFGDYARDLAMVTGTRQRLRLLVGRHLRSLKQSPLLCRLMFLEVRSEQDYRGTAVYELNRRYTQLLVDVLKEGIKAGEFRDDIPLPLLRDMVYGGIEHYTWNFICGRGELDAEKTADQITGVLCNGIAVPAPADDLGKDARRLSEIVDRIERNISRRVRN